MMGPVHGDHNMQRKLSIPHNSSHMNADQYQGDQSSIKGGRQSELDSVDPSMMAGRGGDPVEEEEVEVPTESKISKTLSDRTTKIVIILVLLMLFC